ADSSPEGPSRSSSEPRSEVGPAPGPGARSPGGPGEDSVVRRSDWFRLAFDHSPIGMALVDVHGRFGNVNRALCEILGRPPADLIGAGVHHVSHPGDLARHGELRQQLLRSQASGTESRYEADWRFVRADGELAWTSVTCSLLPAGGGSPAGFLWQVVDRTARRAAESARVLTEELRERHENELTRAHTDLVQFATVAAHDLKSPLQVISGFAGLLEQTHGDDLDERGREFLAFILKSTGRMHTLIDDLLAYAKVGADRRAPVAVPFDRVVDEVRVTLHNEIAGSGASIVCDPLPVVAGDPTQLAHLLGDLVANALKFVAPGVSPRIRISASRMINAWCIEVADNGVGIDPQHRSYVFGMFQRLRRQEYEGTGIGLAICARIVEQRGGVIWVEDNPAGGSRFRFTVPDEPVPPRVDHGWETGDGRAGDGRVDHGWETRDGATLDDPGAGRAGDGRAGGPPAGGPPAGGPPAGAPEAGGPPAGSPEAGGSDPGGSDPGGPEARTSQSPALAPPAWGPDPGGPGTLDILLVEDDDDHARLVQETLANSPDGDYHLRRVRDLAGARIELHRCPAGCILLDLFLPDGQGLESLSHLTTLDPLAPIVILTSLADEEMGLQAVHEGAQDYLVKGTVDGPRLARSLRHAVERKALEARFAEQALHDPLTGLANRTLLLDRVRLELARNERTGSAVAVFYLDVDRFKDINDRCGHAGGDEVLVRVARRLARVVRPGDTVSRIGGDEFVVVCGEVDSEGDVEQVRARIVEALGRPLLLGGGTELISASIGVAVGRGAGEEPEAVIRRADQDMYDVKRRRRQERDEGWRA
ncbi:MAG: hypothetical protein QOI56_929, partial [Actinomycetota bacterium]|nr:hypothetical protein [Actinomycetota bacterium]